MNLRHDATGAAAGAGVISETVALDLIVLANIFSLLSLLFGLTKETENGLAINAKVGAENTEARMITDLRNPSETEFRQDAVEEAVGSNPSGASFDWQVDGRVVRNESYKPRWVGHTLGHLDRC